MSPASAPVLERFGLYPQLDFRISLGNHAGTRLSPAERWYFNGEAIAVPSAKFQPAPLRTATRVSMDLRGWSAGAPSLRSSPATMHDNGWHGPNDGARPSLVWVGAPTRMAGARLSADGATLQYGERRYAFATVPRFVLNRSYFDASSVRYFHERSVAARGNVEAGRFIARALWPEDFALPLALPRKPQAATTGAIRALVRQQAGGNAHEAFAISAGTSPIATLEAGSAVVGLVLNGSQGDDDEAHGGHCALVTGNLGADEQIGQWLVCNFYSLDTVSEKAILPSILPLENYLGDLNSGQSWYRPSWLLLAVLRRERTAEHLQQALSRVYPQFYRHQLVYDHATMNCAGITVDALRAVGWRLRARGPSSRLMAYAGLPWWVCRARSLSKGLATVDYLSEDRTRLFPEAVFEEMGADLLGLRRRKRFLTRFERALADDIVEVVFLRLPQFPSSRATGGFPVVSMREYHARLPKDPAAVKIVPVPPRPFPRALRDPDLLARPLRRSRLALAGWAAALLLVAGLFRTRRRRDGD